jgi:long-chain fatty acid transport protein
VVAVRLNDRWSLGGGLRYVSGDLTYTLREGGSFSSTTGNTMPFGVAVTADGSDDDLGFDLGLQYAAPTWGFGAVYRQGVSLSSVERGRIKLILNTDLPGLPDLPDLFGDLFGQATFRQEVEQPDEIAVGGWFAPSPKLRLELDVAHADSTRSRTTVRDLFNLGGPAAGDELPIVVRDGDETWSVRLGGELEAGARWLLSAGLAWEPTPTAENRASFATPWGDAVVYAIGASYRLPSVTIDAGYSYWDHEDTDQPFNVVGDQVTPITFETSEQILSVSARWSF